MKPVDSEPDTLVSAAEARQPKAGETQTRVLTGYAMGEVIGRGGIGEVILAHDLRVGRDVAIKRLRAPHPSEDESTRFLREARIQARLEHPAIPPVHELGIDDQGRPYFTMKRLAGVTLSDMLQNPAPNRQRLLRAFADVCLAIEFAHSRGVVHRDLKPSNVMIGDFGDVYVLDWGLARMVGEAVAEVVTDDIDSLDVKPSELLGTPGYMAPEQLQRAAEAGRPADIYSLGAILFEILAGEPVHPRGSTTLQSTLSGDAVVPPGKRRPERAIPPELDAVCLAMLAMDDTSRPTARRVAERVEAYLDGDRDVARRTTMAVDLVWSARAAFNEGRRAEAMRASGRALALDPESREAAELITGLMLSPPEELQPELREVLREHELAAVRTHARSAVLAYVALASFLPIAAWNGVRRWDVVIAVFVVSVAMGFAAWRISRKPSRSLAEMLAYGLGNVLLIGAMTRMAGPFTFVPGLAIIIVMSSMAYPRFLVRPALLVALVTLGYLLPIVLELSHVWPATFEIRDGELIGHAGALVLEGRPTLILLVGSAITMLVIAGIYAARLYRLGRDAQRQLVIHAWHLGHFLPSAQLARRASSAIPLA
jgi:eukaryotic-like serine/threonine-protein kinase